MVIKFWTKSVIGTDEKRLNILIKNFGKNLFQFSWNSLHSFSELIMLLQLTFNLLQEDKNQINLDVRLDISLESKQKQNT